MVLLFINGLWSDSWLRSGMEYYFLLCPKVNSKVLNSNISHNKTNNAIHYPDLNEITNKGRRESSSLKLAFSSHYLFVRKILRANFEKNNFVYIVRIISWRFDGKQKLASEIAGRRQKGIAFIWRKRGPFAITPTANDEFPHKKLLFASECGLLPRTSPRRASRSGYPCIVLHHSLGYPL